MSTTHSNLVASLRNVLGNSVGKLRKQGVIPAVIYGYNIESPITISIAYNVFEKMYRTAGNTSVIDLDVEGKVYQVLVHDLQYHPVKDTFVHIDFFSVDLKKVTEAEVPLTFTGVPAPVKSDGAVLNKLIEHVTVSALPDLIPDHIRIDLTSIKKMSDTIEVGDISLPSSITIITDKNTTIASVTSFIDEVSSSESVE